ncbi:hypothetical protein BZA70DRAFT_293296 [Myxozyma melibiosi]|uniref:Regulator of phospholipase D SRF1 n=1 Tax=Myxozyma melibiosi TaxID=54550 RepID=A0ABR1FDS5_9ASCO
MPKSPAAPEIVLQKADTLPDTSSRKSEGSVALLRPNSIPVWAAAKLDGRSAGSKSSNSPTTTASSDRLGPRTSSTQASSTSYSPPSPILAATKTTMPLSLAPERSNTGTSRWSEFVSLSQLPGQTKTENDLRLMSQAVRSDGLSEEKLPASPGVKSSGSIPHRLSEKLDNESESFMNDNSLTLASGTDAGDQSSRQGDKSAHLFFHKKRKIIAFEDLEKQMDLTGPWNPAHDHSTTNLDSGRADGLAVPENAVSASHHHRSDAYSINSNIQSSISRSSVDSHFVMTADLAARRANRKLNLRVMLLNNPYVPMTLRCGIFVLSILALALAASIYHFTRMYKADSLSQQSSTIMAICVQSCALVYLVYITYDEYSGKPLGLRDAKDKVKLIMLDLIFIIFSSANLALTFNTLYDYQWVCASPDTSMSDNTPYDSHICRRQRGLAAFLFLVLIMWVMTFTISILRVVERASGGSRR